MFLGLAKMHLKRPCTDGVLPRPEDELELQSRPRKIRPIIQNILLCGRITLLRLKCSRFYRLFANGVIP